MQAYGLEGGSRQLPSGLSKKEHFNLKVWACTALRSGFKVDIRARVKGTFQHSCGVGCLGSPCATT